MATADSNSGAFRELYSFLLNCFTRADKSFSGQINLDNFDSLIEEAAALPRKYGYAPVTSSLYPSDSQRKAARSKQFKQIDKANKGYITLDEWVSFALDHIFAKADQLPKDYLSGTTNTVTKAEFISFVKKAVNKNSAEYRQLYHFLLKVFQNGDVKREGLVNPEAFDRMIEAAAAAPRRFGLAPRSEEMFPNPMVSALISLRFLIVICYCFQARLEKRKEYFARMDVDGNGTISFDEWLNYAYDHIVAKAATV